MADISWIKLKTKMFDDEKIQLIEAMPEADAILVIWVKLLVQAGKTNANGYIMLTENIPYSVEMLSTIFRRPLQIIKFALKVLVELGMITMDKGNVISVTNWEKHQNVAGLDKIREQGRLRQAKFRDQKRLAPPKKQKKSNVTVTQGNATDIDKEEEYRYIPTTLLPLISGGTMQPDRVYKEYFLEYIPVSLHTQKFIDAWVDWVDYRKEKKKKLTSKTAKLQIKKLSGQPDPADLIYYTIEKGWVGLYSGDQMPKQVTRIESYASSDFMNELLRKNRES